MPLTKRNVSPQELCRHRIPPSVKQDELECVANGALANCVRQLASLSRHAEDVFGELFHEAVKLQHRCTQLAARTDRLAVKVAELNSNDERTPLSEIGMRKAFRSAALVDQQSLSRQTLPTALAECYARADKPPDLDKLNVFREDDRRGLKFYTDPEYFFDLWRQEMLKDSENVKRSRHPKHRSAERPQPAAGAQPQQVPQHQLQQQHRVRPPRDHRQEMVNAVIQKFPEEYQTPEFLRQQQAARAAAAGQQPSSSHYLNGSQQAYGTYSRYQQPPPGMVRPEVCEASSSGAPAATTYTPAHGPGNNVSSGYQSAADSYGSLPHYNVGYVASPQQHGQQQRQGYNGQSQRPVNLSHAGHTQHDGAPPSATQTIVQRQQQQQQRDPSSPAASSASGSRSTPTRGGTPRPAHAPPAPPPLTSPERANGDLPHDMDCMRLNGRSSSPELPPPPPPLLANGLASSFSSQAPIMSTSVMTDQMPSPPPDAANGGVAPPLQNGPPLGGNIPPPPPPPPPSALMGGGKRADANPSQAAPAVKPKKPVAPVMDAHSDLLKAIRAGITLKKVDRAKEQERDEKAAMQGHDVAAILRKRMEAVHGGHSDQSDDAADEPNSDEWDDE